MRNFFLSLRDVMHAVIVKFVHAYLPTANKAFNARVANQTELTLEEIAEKAAVYNINVDPDVIAEGANAFFTLCCYLCADGYKLKTPLFNSYMRIPGEYEGYETHLPEGLYPTVRMEASAAFRNYIRERVKITFDGIDEANGFIAELYDVKTGTINDRVTESNLAEIRGVGLKVLGDEKNKDKVGVYFVDINGLEDKVSIIPVNENKLLKVIVPSMGESTYTIVIRTQSSARGQGSSHVLKDVREMRSEFTVDVRYHKDEKVEEGEKTE
jgi:hypothetical protein